MKRITSVAIMMLVAFILSVVAVAEDAELSFCGTFSGSANFTPSGSSSLGINLTFSYSGFTAISNTNFAAFPTLGATQGFTLEYFWDSFMFASELDLRLHPLALQSWDVYGKMSFADTTGDGVDEWTIRGYFKADVFILPMFSATSTLYVNMTSGLFFASSRSVFDLAPISFQTQRFNVTLDFLRTTFDGSGGSKATGKLGTYIDALPSFSITLWLDVSLTISDLTAGSNTSFNFIPGASGTQTLTFTYSVGNITLISKTTFNLVAFGFKSEYLRINAVHNGLSAYAWSQFVPSRPSVGIGFSYSFCPRPS